MDYENSSIRGRSPSCCQNSSDPSGRGHRISVFMCLTLEIASMVCGSKVVLASEWRPAEHHLMLLLNCLWGLCQRSFLAHHGNGNLCFTRLGFSVVAHQCIKCCKNVFNQLCDLHFYISGSAHELLPLQKEHDEGTHCLPEEGLLRRLLLQKLSV